MLCTENLNSTFIIKSKLVISKLLVSPLLSSTIVEQRPLVPYWGGMGEALFFFFNYCMHC